MKKVYVRSSKDIKASIESPDAKRAATKLLSILRTAHALMFDYEDYLESLLDDPSYFDATVAEIRRLESVLNS